MSMIGNFLLVSEDDLALLASAPAKVHGLLDERVYDPAEPIDYVDVDKAWHALHFWLTGTAWQGTPPLNFIAMGGQPIGTTDIGYGPARALRATEVVLLHRALDALPPELLVKRLDAATMKALEIYPGGWDEPGDLTYYATAYEELRALVRRGSETGRGLLIWMT